MSETTLGDLQESIRDRSAFEMLSEYSDICCAFLNFVEQTDPTRIISPSHQHYIFYQYSEDYQHKITRPLNSDLFIESLDDFKGSFERFVTFLDNLRSSEGVATTRVETAKYLESNEINRVVYTIQQSIGSIGDSFENANQSRKRIGQLFETLVTLLVQEVGFECESRTVNIPIPGNPEYAMSYQLDLVFSRNKAIVTSETSHIHPAEVVGSVKTTSKDRIDRIFLDKHLMTSLIGRDIPVVAIFLHDVQRAKRGNSIFGINSTFKSNHFLGYTVALNRLDGVYYVDPRPEMLENQRLREQISDFGTFLARDLWAFAK